MDSIIVKLLKAFARTDGLLKGTALLSNLVTMASISILPGFGVSGLFLANTIQMSIAGLLELPTGILADRFGWGKALIGALVLKFLVTFSFLAAVIAAESGNSSLVWFFFTCEAIVDSFASSFFSGAYQAAYFNWYERNLARASIPISEAPPLFLASFRHAVRIRFLLPLILVGVVLVLQTLARNFGLLGSYSVAYGSIAVILILRLLVLSKVWGKA